MSSSSECLPCEPCVPSCSLEDLFSAKSVDTVGAETGFSERELSTLSLFSPGILRRYSLGQMTAGAFVSEADVSSRFLFLVSDFLLTILGHRAFKLFSRYLF